MKSLTDGTVRRADLRRSGFTAKQIATLEQLRKRYPLIELSRSRRELDRLAFLRWQYRSGRITI